MQERFEENSPQIPSYTSAIPLPSGEPTSETERLFTAAWNKKQYAECRELLPQMPTNITSGTLNLLLAIALRPLNWKERWLSTTIALRRECVYYLVKLSTPARMMELKPLLFDNDSEIQDAVFDMFHRASKEALPMLLDGVIATLRNVSPNIPAHKRGMLETIQIFKEAKGKEAVAFLGEFGLGQLPTYPFNGRWEKGLKYGAIGVGVLIAGYLTDMLLGSPQEMWQAVLLYIVLILIGSILSAGLFYIGSFTLSLPYMIIRDNRVQALFQAEAIQGHKMVGTDGEKLVDLESARDFQLRDPDTSESDGYSG
ncbi:MAG: hypothetical protein NT023_01425 [Armatimonadetes bacterium]|nr:hypothetical protein [Armatimonadota bacterium]